MGTMSIGSIGGSRVVRSILTVGEKAGAGHHQRCAPVGARRGQAKGTNASDLLFRRSAVIGRRTSRVSTVLSLFIGRQCRPDEPPGPPMGVRPPQKAC